MMFALSAIREDDGAPTALLCTLRETTERVLVTRLVACLDALSTRCFPADTAEEACLIAADVTSGCSAGLAIHAHVSRGRGRAACTPRCALRSGHAAGRHRATGGRHHE